MPIVLGTRCIKFSLNNISFISIPQLASTIRYTTDLTIHLLMLNPTKLVSLLLAIYCLEVLRIKELSIDFFLRYNVYTFNLFRVQF